MSAADANPATVPDYIGGWEKLGRGIFSDRQGRQSAKGTVPYQVFLERIGVLEISVDRLTCAPTADVVVAIAERVGAQRNPPRDFYGWAVLEAEKARQLVSRVNATPLPDNPYHADIVLPDVAVESREAQEQYAVKLASASKWRSRHQSEN